MSISTFEGMCTINNNFKCVQQVRKEKNGGEKPECDGPMAT